MTKRKPLNIAGDEQIRKVENGTVEIMKAIIKVIIVAFLMAGCANQDIAKTNKAYTFHLLMNKVVVNMPVPVTIKRTSYEEGVIYFIYFRDGGYVILFSGTMMQFDVDKYTYSDKVSKKNYTTYIGTKDNLCWRKDVYHYLRCYYANVPPASKKEYDRILDKLKVGRGS